MNCRECVEFLMAYMDGELPADEVAHFEKHMELCPPCKVYLDTYRKTVELEKSLGKPTAEPPRGVPEELIQAILKAKEMG